MRKDGRSIRSGTRIPGARQQMARVSRPAPWTLAKVPFLNKAKDTNGSLNTVAIMDSPFKIPLELVKDKDGLLAKDKDGFPTKVVRLS